MASSPEMPDDAPPLAVRLVKIPLDFSGGGTNNGHGADGVTGCRAAAATTTDPPSVLWPCLAFAKWDDLKDAALQWDLLPDGIDKAGQQAVTLYLQERYPHLQRPSRQGLHLDEMDLEDPDDEDIADDDDDAVDDGGSEADAPREVGPLVLLLGPHESIPGYDASTRSFAWGALPLFYLEGAGTTAPSTKADASLWHLRLQDPLLGVWTATTDYASHPHKVRFWHAFADVLLHHVAPLLSKLQTMGAAEASILSAAPATTAKSATSQGIAIGGRAAIFPRAATATASETAAATPARNLVPPLPAVTVPRNSAKAKTVTSGTEVDDAAESMEARTTAPAAWTPQAPTWGGSAPQEQPFPPMPESAVPPPVAASAPATAADVKPLPSSAVLDTRPRIASNPTSSTADAKVGSSNSSGSTVVSYDEGGRGGAEEMAPTPSHRSVASSTTPAGHSTPPATPASRCTTTATKRKGGRTTSSHKKARSAKADAPVKPKEWVDVPRFPSFDEVWPLLVKAGYSSCGPSIYRRPDHELADGRLGDGTFYSPHELRRDLCAHGLEDCELWSDEERSRVTLWIVTAVVSDPCSGGTTDQPPRRYEEWKERDLDAKLKQLLPKDSGGRYIVSYNSGGAGDGPPPELRTFNDGAIREHVARFGLPHNELVESLSPYERYCVELNLTYHNDPLYVRQAADATAPSFKVVARVTVAHEPFAFLRGMQRGKAQGRG